MFLSLVGLVNVCAKFQLPSLSKSGLKVPGGVVVVWLRPILVFSLSLSQAEQKLQLFKWIFVTQISSFGKTKTRFIIPLGGKRKLKEVLPVPILLCERDFVFCS